MEPKLGPLGQTFEGIGHISQVQLADGTWVSWTLWTTGDHRLRADEHAASLLAKNPDRFVRARVVRVDHTVVATHAPGHSTGMFEAKGEWKPSKT